MSGCVSVHTALKQHFTPFVNVMSENLSGMVKLI